MRPRLARYMQSALLVLLGALLGGGSYALATDPATSPCNPPPVTDPPPVTTTDTPSASGLFGASSIWNKPLADNAELDPQNDMYVTELNRLIDKFKAAADGPQIATRQYSTPVYKVPADQPTVHVTLDYTVPEAATLQTAFDAVPIPANATAAAGLDEQMTVWQPSTDKLWEFWKMEKKADGWHARWGGAIDHVSTDPGYYTTSTWPGSRTDWGASGSSLPLIAGTVLIKEAQEGHIDHALAFALPTVRYRWYTPPAQRTDGNSAAVQSIPEGAHFRLDPTLDLNTLSLNPFQKMLAKAMQRYGLIVRDVSSGPQFYGEDHTPTGTNPWPAIIGPAYPNNTWSLLAKLPWKRMQLLKTDLRKNDNDP